MSSWHVAILLCYPTYDVIIELAVTFQTIIFALLRIQPAPIYPFVPRPSRRKGDGAITTIDRDPVRVVQFDSIFEPSRMLYRGRCIPVHALQCHSAISGRVSNLQPICVCSSNQHSNNQHGSNQHCFHVV